MVHRQAIMHLYLSAPLLVLWLSLGQCATEAELPSSSSDKNLRTRNLFLGWGNSNAGDEVANTETSTDETTDDWFGGILNFLFGEETAEETIIETCTTLQPLVDFDVDTYISKPWYVHKQAVIQYQPIEQFYCVRAQYSRQPEDPGFLENVWDYDISVNNEARDMNGNVFGGELCADIVGEAEQGRLRVAPCFLPPELDLPFIGVVDVAGPYWVVAYDEAEGYALISGGQPENNTGNGCTTGTGVNNSGLWIFSRDWERNEDLISRVESMASEVFGFDTSVLEDVVQTGCGWEDTV